MTKFLTLAIPLLLMLLTLNPVEKLEFQEEVDKIKPKQQKEQVMQMVTSWMEEGIEMGEQQAFLKMVRQVLLRRVGADRSRG
jgi:hypothetical protein